MNELKAALQIVMDQMKQKLEDEEEVQANNFSLVLPFSKMVVYLH